MAFTKASMLFVNCAAISMALGQSVPSYADKVGTPYLGDALFFEGNLCAPDEVVFSNCEMIHKTASLCGKKNGTNEVNGLQYRFGTRDVLEFYFPNNLDNSLKKFTLSKLGASGSETHITFENDGYEYIIFGKDPLGERSSYGVAVKHGSRLIAVNKCTRGRPAIFQEAYRILQRGPFAEIRGLR